MKNIQLWYSEQVCFQLEEESDEVKPVNLHLSAVKPLGTKWLMKMYDHFKSDSQIVLTVSKNLDYLNSYKYAILFSMLFYLWVTTLYIYNNIDYIFNIYNYVQIFVPPVVNMHLVTM